MLTKKIIPPQRDSLHRIDYYLDIIEKSGLKIEDRYTEFFIEDEDLSFVDNFLSKHAVEKKDFVVVLNPGGNWLAKRWPKEYWTHLADKLISDFGAKVIITGSHNDLSLVKHIQDDLLHKSIIACGVFNIKQLGALAKRADLFITADTGPLHIANSVGAKKIIAIFGPTSPQITGPYPIKNVVILQKEVGCLIPCYEVHCKDSRCMKAVSVEDVINQVKLLKRNND